AALHLWGAATADVMASERFNAPTFPWVPVPDATTHRLLLWIGVVAAVAMSAGLVTRLSSAVTVAVVGGDLLVDLPSFGHNRAFLTWCLLALALSPLGGELSLDARRRGGPRRTSGTLWPMWLARIVCSTVYLSSGGSKWFDEGWRSGAVTWDRVVRTQRHLEGLPFDDMLIDVLTARSFHTVIAPVILATEVVIGLGLWHRRTRLAAVWLAVAFHVSIEISANVQTFSLSAIAALSFWVTPARRRFALTGGGPALRAVVARLDWYARFAHAGADGPLRVTAADGRTCDGAAAGWRVASRLPLTAWPAGIVGGALAGWRSRDRRREPG
ncbi:MAG: HTTM domain-containing protein, partial [Actinomycetota bacterium]|nr:HTTM domain-containing protein [Actinomycetota bacterium]